MDSTGLRGIVPLVKDGPDCRIALIRWKLVSWGEGEEVTEGEEEPEEETDIVERSNQNGGFFGSIDPASYKYIPQALRHP